jgi:hypothetical protein
MNEIARDGWELLTARWDRGAGSYGKHHLYWRRLQPTDSPEQPA